MKAGVLRRLGALVSLTIVGLLTWVGAAAAAPTPSEAPHPDIVVLAVPGMLWSDALNMPQFQDLASHSAVGELSVKARSSVDRCSSAMLTVSAGNRASGPLPPCELDLSLWSKIVAGNRNSRFDARVGALGTSLQAAGIKTVTVGTLPIPMLANSTGSVDVVAPTLAKALSAGGVVAIVDQRLYAVPLLDRATAQRRVDAHIQRVRQALPPGSTLIVAGISDLAVGHANLHAIAINGPGWRHTEMRSSAAGRAPYVQLIDVAPTILTALHVPVPTFMVGRPMQQSGTAVPPISAFVDDNRHAVLQRTLGQHVFLTVGIATILMMVLATASGRLAHRVALVLARLIAPAPAMIFLANGFHWWRWNQKGYGVILFAGCLIGAAVTTFIARRSKVGAMVAMPVLSFVALSIDQFTGATLQLSSPLGDNPIVAGRFSGMGNIDFTVLATSAILIAGLLGGRIRSRPIAILVAGSFALAAIIIDGSPSLGNDIGGVLALVPAALITCALVGGVRFTKTRVFGVGLTTIVVATGVALADYSRPATAQTHVGRFVGQVLHGGAGTEVHRKADAALATFGLTIGTFLVGFSIVLGLLGRQRIRAALASVPGGTAAGVGAGVVGVLGAVVNDSGIVIAAMASLVATTSLYGGGMRSAKPVGPADATGGATA